ncbi:hypothetical protein [Sphingomonas sp. BAUL-RG-20F-R05-02]|uniref:hypothetical protein n=1 Tax=Sphingomonas sp. BAUL-RG-20F-R05-02 TaxID=2914830 RepID=UPI001F57D0C6|nr:hypothetical protein [Sphingomonas sp. BAUL-RG-20F-R05-02]
MRSCFVVFTDPGRVMQGMHRTVDGATVAAVSCGAARMPDGSDVTIDAVAKLLRNAPSVSFACHEWEDAETAHIERHPILL